MPVKDFPIGYRIAPLRGKDLEENLRVQDEILIFAKHFSDVRVKLEALQLGFTVAFAELLRREAQGTLIAADAETLRIRRSMDAKLCHQHPVECVTTEMRMAERAQFGVPLVVNR